MTDKLITGGAENYFCSLENQLAHPDLTIFSAAASGELYPKIKNKNHFIEMKRKSHMFNLLLIKEKIMQHNIDIIHANSLRMVLYSIVCRFLAKRKIRLIYTKHNVTGLEKKFPSLFCKVINKHVDTVITVSNFEKDNLIGLGIRTEKIKTIYNGVNLKQFKFERKGGQEIKKIGILARLSIEKNHELFIEIAEKLKHNPELMFYIAGDGPEYTNIKNRIAEMNLQTKVKLLGAVKNPEKFIREMDVLLLTSEREVFPMVILEAMAVGTPIISIDRGGIREAVEDNTTGFLISDHSAEDFSSRLIYLAENKNIQTDVIENARNKVTVDFSLEKMLRNTLNEYLNMLNKV
jgi:glycosyltransferase involved in cell wall biosynthesis